MQMRLRSVILTAALLGCSAKHVDAGSAIDVQLARLQRVSLRVSTNLHFQPPPGLDAEKVKAVVAERSRSALVKGGVSVDDSARQRLYVDVTRPIRDEESDRVLVRVNLSLIEPARLERETPTVSSQSTSEVVSWQSDRFEYCEVDEIAGVASELAVEAVAEFLEKAGQATAWANESAAR